MTLRKLVILLFVLEASSAVDSSMRAQTTPQPTPAPQIAKPAQSSPAIAIVNGQTVTLADLDPKLKEAVDGLDASIAELRKNVLGSRIATLLLEGEAKRRKITVEQLVEAEVTDKVIGPTDDDIRAVYEANKAQMNGADLASVRSDIINYIHDQRAQKLADDLVARLRAANPVVMGADVNSRNLATVGAVATVAGKQITGADLAEQLKPLVYKLQMQVYEAEASAIDQKINDILLGAEAKRRNIAEAELIRIEITAKTKKPTEAEIAKFYQENRDKITGDFAMVKEGIASYLEEHDRTRAELALAKSLRAAAKVQVVLKEPEAPVQVISVDDDPSRGPLNAPVTIVQFTDFQCPTCAQMHPVLDSVIKEYGDKIRWVIRDFPLSRHENARRSANAANAANAQGKFWEFIELLYKNQSTLDTIGLRDLAGKIGLDRAKFDAALNSSQYAAEVSHDLADGELYGVDGTPTIFINGVRLKDLTREGLKAAIDSALAQPKRP